MKLILVGDTHGVKNDIWNACREAGDRKIAHVVVLGDFGLWDHTPDGVEFLDECNEAARVNNLSIYAIGGNHENWDHWEAYAKMGLPRHKGFTMVRRRVLLSDKVNKWVWHNKQFVAAGGAVSIDKDWRLAREAGERDEFGNRTRGGMGERTLYWPNEQLTDEQVAEIEGWGIKADYLLTHDCSNNSPFFDRMKPDLDSQIHRQRIDKVLRATKPEMHFHGHMHNKFDWINTNTFQWEHGTQTYGLECNNDWWSWGVLDLELDKFYWRGQEPEVTESQEDEIVKADEFLDST